jgi:putative endonuclease
MYTGVTGNLYQRLWQHRTGGSSKFAAKHKAMKLVWFDETDDVTVAIAHEKKIKGWRRDWKLELVESANPEWLDLADGWYDGRGDVGVDE